MLHEIRIVWISVKNTRQATLNKGIQCIIVLNLHLQPYLTATKHANICGQ